MQKVGKLVTCDRCGKTLFLEDEVPMYTAKDIGEDAKYGLNNEEWKCWAVTSDGKDLCPECAAHYERMMGYFWNGAKVDPAEEIVGVDDLKSIMYFGNTREGIMEGISRAFEDITTKNESE